MLCLSALPGHMPQFSAKVAARISLLFSLAHTGVVPLTALAAASAAMNSGIFQNAMMLVG